MCNALQGEISNSKWALSNTLKNMQDLVKMMLSWLLQDLHFAISALFVGVSFYRLRFVVPSSNSRSFVCFRQMVLQQSVEVAHPLNPRVILPPFFLTRF
jgi:hypothetical protein